MQKIKPRKTKEFERDDKGAILMSKDNLKPIVLKWAFYRRM